ncbi:hypothetical protein Syun_001870 [Stephania yunnanensis]|uniref:Uncharacterized protein n=1 Tax=Stephania yunnanensis TaxID=152371 RepID=A0AAP0LFK4_9MAGN
MSDVGEEDDKSDNSNFSSNDEDVDVMPHLLVRASVEDLVDDLVVDPADDPTLLEIDNQMDHTVALMTMLVHRHRLLRDSRMYSTLLSSLPTLPIDGHEELTNSIVALTGRTTRWQWRVWHGGSGGSGKSRNEDLTISILEVTSRSDGKKLRDLDLKWYYEDWWFATTDLKDLEVSRFKIVDLVKKSRDLEDLHNKSEEP